jgi:tRNA A37 N6-isopentenylltransferase MiaA
MPIVDHTELLRILESTDLGLELASSALDSHRESSKQILGTLLAYASILSKDRLEQLVDQMAMANMTESLRNLWSETVSAAKGSSQSVSVAALLAASVGGIQDANMIESLKEAGLYPLAFLYASVWGAGGPANRVESVETAWKQALA